MGVASLTNLTGTTAAATPLANDRALVNNMLLDVELTNNVTEKQSAFEIKQTYSAAEIAAIEALEGGGGGGTGAAITGLVGIFTFRTWIPFTLLEWRVVAKEVATGAGNAWDGTHNYAFTLQKGTTRAGGGTWATLATLSHASLSTLDVKASSIANSISQSDYDGGQYLVRCLLVKNNTPHACDFQLSMKAKWLHETA